MIISLRKNKHDFYEAKLKKEKKNKEKHAGETPICLIWEKGMKSYEQEEKVAV